ncbi:hypothetical protein HMPREF0621_0965 [Pasteurella dagmatis ATCC 43325]|uniref:Uncharacterized protein n=1 Tax=Pasteurella dagmatis ATCC 43325 TaxID=667128 RepID=C9PPP1_9PAST|nr:hypothetical protein HMPREF0621_0965 [Pasteurella dagmatis ATCC 43325]
MKAQVNTCAFFVLIKILKKFNRTFFNPFSLLQWQSSAVQAK